MYHNVICIYFTLYRRFNIVVNPRTQKEKKIALFFEKPVECVTYMKQDSKFKNSDPGIEITYITKLEGKDYANKILIKPDFSTVKRLKLPIALKDDFETNPHCQIEYN